MIMYATQQIDIVDFITKNSTGILVFSFVIAIIIIVALCKIFQKANEPGWKAIIPFYNTYTLYKIAWERKYFWINFTLAIFSFLIYFLLPQIAFINGIFYLISFVIVVLLYNKLSHCFYHEAGFTIGLVVLPCIFLLILAFSNDEYTYQYY